MQEKYPRLSASVRLYPQQGGYVDTWVDLTPGVPFTRDEAAARYLRLEADPDCYGHDWAALLAAEQRRYFWTAEAPPWELKTVWVAYGIYRRSGGDYRDGGPSGRTGEDADYEYLSGRKTDLATIFGPGDGWDATDPVAPANRKSLPVS